MLDNERTALKGRPNSVDFLYEPSSSPGFGLEGTGRSNLLSGALSGRGHDGRQPRAEALGYVVLPLRGMHRIRRDSSDFSLSTLNNLSFTTDR